MLQSLIWMSALCSGSAWATPGDKDNDGLSDADEKGWYGTNPRRADTDHDGFSDLEEVIYGGDPLLFASTPDDDGDGVLLIYEEELGSDPLSADTDGDGWDDWLEWIYTSDPSFVLDPASTPDDDGDGVYELYETLELGSDPLSADTDGDGWDDWSEWIYTSDPSFVLDPASTPDDDADEVYEVYETLELGSDPLSADTDGDGWDDWSEWIYGLDGFVLRADRTPDDDADGLYAVYERHYGCRTRSADTDADGWDDWTEVIYAGVCDRKSITPDDDGDGLYRVYELELGTAPRNPDSDADGVTDGAEFLVGSDPLDPLSF